MTTSPTRQLYRRRAARYDGTFWLVRAAGLRDGEYRRLAAQSLGLRPGDTVVDLGCGTGLNFSHLLERVGPAGHVYGVDLTDAMLDQARERVRRAGWSNVTLVESDMADYLFPPDVRGVISTLAVTLCPEFDSVIRRAATALGAGGRLAIVDLKEPGDWPRWLLRFAAWTQRPFGVSLDLAHRHPWESVRAHLHEVMFREFYRGAVYLSVGEKK